MTRYRGTVAGATLISAIVAFAVIATRSTSAQAPVTAFFDFSGEYAVQFHEDQPERVPGPEIGDYLGMPINAAARLHGDSWDASLLTLPEYQCKPHPADYGSRGPNVRIWKEVDGPSQRLIAFHTHNAWQAQERTIWMDGRPRPPQYAAHTWQGFSTGEFEGDSLTITTTHIKAGYIRRNGLARSDDAQIVEHWNRHDRYLTWMVWINDPHYLTEPLVRTSDYVENKSQQIAPYPCQVVTEIDRTMGIVPHHLPGTNPFLDEFSRRTGVPFEATRGGAETMYPEYVDKVKTMPKPPALK
jgi:hypothetical protein